jgi:hypothetical protein
MTRIVSYQKASRNSRIASASLSTTCHETMLRCAELQGYENISDFVRDAILSKCEETAYAMLGIMKDSKSKHSALASV